jgi:O-methyltransferase involved in polyketide biosynthesis
MIIPKADNYRQISDTAKFPAYLRAFSDIPWASEVYSFLRQLSPVDTQQIFGLNYSKFTWMAPLTEARQKCIDHYLERNSCDLIIELGAGFSLRWNQIRPVGEYLDSDLCETIALKLKLLKELKISIPGNVQIKAVNPFEINFLEFLRENYPCAKSITIVHEGLAQYFSHEELKVLAKIIHGLSNDYEVRWVSTDFSTVEQYQAYYDYCSDMHTLSLARTKSSGRDLMANAFPNLSSLEHFFRKLGFEVRNTPQLDSIELISSMSVMGARAESFIEHFRPHLKLWELRPIVVEHDGPRA